jgi:hypothetical protein
LFDGWFEEEERYIKQRVLLHIAVELSTKLGIGKWRTVRCLKRSIESSEEVKRDLSRSPETCLRDL